ncbi:hypothetical protein TSUD_83910 [Trifolium subterraneum]|uniref:Glucose-methanol-choline oxidoreductase N-terminal domain-containing protein n=1 Tax=Trifolium subterraneum TaxID=3900 RepID=A0A2Z6LYD6_TRISU|nr:hypothetical protein TSUD_83910 [Trifolium subterraneum]
MHENDSTLQQSQINKGLNVTLDSENNTLKIKCDAVVVGSRSRGGITTSVLSNGGHKVLVLKKGNYFVREDYSSLEGSTVGGSSAVNWQACIRTPKKVLKEWKPGRPPLGDSIVPMTCGWEDKVYEKWSSWFPNGY